MARIAASLKEKAKEVALKAEAKKERQRKREETAKKRQEIKEKRVQNKEKKAQEKLAKENESLGKVKKTRAKKKSSPRNECLNQQKCCFKCGLVYGAESESNRNMWRNCKFKLSCPNWYCFKCVPAHSSSSEIICSKCQVN